VHGDLHGGEDAPRVRQQSFSSGQQAHAGRVPLEERRAELVLEPADAARERRLRDVQALGRARQVGLLGDGHERA